MVSRLADRHIQARNYTNASRNRAGIELVVVHTMESPEAQDTAENVARWFAGTNAPKASAHYCLDNNSIVSCVDESDVAWAAPGANHNGVQLELAGKAGQSDEQWADAYSKALLARAAKLTADICKRHGIPANHLSNSELRAGKRGIIGHVQASEVFKQSTHWDPGPKFPWTSFMWAVRKELGQVAQVRFVLTDGEGKQLKQTGPVDVGYANEKAALLRFHEQTVTAQLKELRADGDVGLRRVKAS